MLWEVEEEYKILFPWGWGEVLEFFRNGFIRGLITPLKDQVSAFFFFFFVTVFPSMLFSAVIYLSERSQETSNLLCAQSIVWLWLPFLIGL